MAASHAADLRIATARRHSTGIVQPTTGRSPIVKKRGTAAGIQGWIVEPCKGDAVLATLWKLAEDGAKATPERSRLLDLAGSPASRGRKTGKAYSRNPETDLTSSCA